MTSKQDLIEQAEKLQQELDILKEKIEQCDKTEYIRWRANECKSYYTVDLFGNVEQYTEVNSCKDEFSYSSGNYFETRQEAEDYKENLITKQKLKDLALRLNKNTKIDWSDISQSKYHIYYDYDLDELYTCSCCSTLIFGQVYCLSSDFLKIAKQEIGKNKLIQLIKSGV